MFSPYSKSRVHGYCHIGLYTLYCSISSSEPIPPLKFAACSIVIRYIFILSFQDHAYLGVITKARDYEILPRSSLSLDYLVEIEFILLVNGYLTSNLEL